MKEQQFTKEDIQKIVRDEMMKNYRSGAPKVPPHVHNGVDSLKINQSNLIINSKGRTFFAVTTPQASGGDIVTLDLITNPSSLSFYGIAYYPANGPSTNTTTKKAIITGQLELGNCFGTNGDIVQVLDTNVIGACNAVLFTGTTNIGTGVFTQSDVSVYANQNNGIFATIDGTTGQVFGCINTTEGVSSNELQGRGIYTDKSISLRFIVGTDWVLTGSIIIT